MFLVKFLVLDTVLYFLEVGDQNLHIDLLLILLLFCYFLYFLMLHLRNESKKFELGKKIITIIITSIMIMIR